MDGVSLEMEKWKRVLSDMGFDVRVAAGNESPSTDILLPFLSIDSKEDDVEKIKRELERVLKDVDIIVVENIWSLALRIPVGLALEEIAKSSSKLFLGHHHDFWWERGRDGEILRKHFPPDLRNARHVVINSIAKEELKKRRGIESTVIPNVIDPSVFDGIKDLRGKIGVPKGSIMALQATRVVRRKAIEISIELVARLQEILKDRTGERLYRGERFDGNVFLAIGGMVEDEGYMKNLERLAQERGVNLVDVYDLVQSGEARFWDVYSVGDFVTYPSVLEGWGNQLLEAFAAGKPVVLFEYEVFRRDIKPLGFDYVSLGSAFEISKGLYRIDGKNLENAAKEISTVLFDSDLYRKIVKKNREIVERELSLDALRRMLEEVIG